MAFVKVVEMTELIQEALGNDKDARYVNGGLLGQLLLLTSREIILLCKCKWETTAFSYTHFPPEGVEVRGIIRGISL